MLMAMIENIYETMNLRITETAFELHLRKIYPTVLETKDYICAEGVIPIALVAHMDTVFFKPATTIYYDRQKNTMWSPMGLGADDRAGVFAIIQILQSGLRPHIIFTTDEEKGCLGAEALAKTECPFAVNPKALTRPIKPIPTIVIFISYTSQYIGYILHEK